MKVLSVSMPGTDGEANCRLRPADATDIETVAALEARAGLNSVCEKRLEHWRDLFKRFGSGRKGGHFLVATREDRIIGFALGEVRAFEFSSPPCGWIFALLVAPEERGQGVGAFLYQTLCTRFRSEGSDRTRVMVPRSGGPQSAMSFCRHLGMTTGPYIQFEKAILS